MDTARSLLVIWDIDLTLIHAGGFGHREVDTIISELGGSVPSGLTFAGRTDHAIWSEILDHNGLPGSLLPQVLADYATACTHARWSGKFMPGAAESFQIAGTIAAAQTVVTGNTRTTGLLKLAHAGVPTTSQSTMHSHPGSIDISLAGFGDHAARRHDVLFSCLEAWRARGGTHAIAIGDTPHDIDAAHEHDIPVIAVAAGLYTADELAGADHVLPDLTHTDQFESALRSTLMG
ncbi:HAD family hydrolase [Corynebacterium sp. H113]|uniref:HAD family hydrolase n=1 Tax=Corynebacterium sp. H113 TaxID=3133419 RepID=UPI0030983E54